MITIGFKDTSIYIDIIRICSELLVWREKGKSKEEKKKKKEEKKKEEKKKKKKLFLALLDCCSDLKVSLPLFST